MTRLARLAPPSGAPERWIVDAEGTPLARIDHGTSLADLLRLRLAELDRVLDATRPLSPNPTMTLLSPIDGATEVWATGVTYHRSEEARVEESDTPDIYTKIYRAERPELFFKSTARRVAGPSQPIAIRADSEWNVPEPELALVVNAHAEIVGYTIGNDVSSRSIEGENPLYLPQAKVYAGACALGPAIVCADEVIDPYALRIAMRIERAGTTAWAGDTTTRELRRSMDQLVSYLFREDEFPDGALLLTGTGLVPDADFTLKAGDVVEIEIEQLGLLRNPVVRGKSALRRPELLALPRA